MWSWLKWGPKSCGTLSRLLYKIQLPEFRLFFFFFHFPLQLAFSLDLSKFVLHRVQQSAFTQTLDGQCEAAATIDMCNSQPGYEPVTQGRLGLLLRSPLLLLQTDHSSSYRDESSSKLSLQMHFANKHITFFIQSFSLKWINWTQIVAVSPFFKSCHSNLPVCT